MTILLTKYCHVIMTASNARLYSLSEFAVDVRDDLDLLCKCRLLLDSQQGVSAKWWVGYTKNS